MIVLAENLTKDNLKEHIIVLLRFTTLFIDWNYQSVFLSSGDIPCSKQAIYIVVNDVPIILRMFFCTGYV